MNVSHIRQNSLINNIIRQYKFLHEYEKIRDLSSDPKEIERCNQEIIRIKEYLSNYIQEYQSLCQNENIAISQDLMPILNEIGLLKIPKHGDYSGDIMVKVLFLAACPINEVRLRIDEESREIQEKLELSKMRENFQLSLRMAVRPEDLTQMLLNIEPRIVHFSGHGSTLGALYLEDKVGQSHPVEADTLGHLFKLVADHVECVILNACYTNKQANAIAKYIPYVMGMNNNISDRAAIAFSVGFYQALGAGKSIEKAYEFGVVQIKLQKVPDHLMPILLKTKDIL